MTALLTLRGVHTHLGGYHILHGVDLNVPQGGVTMLLGRNGAGKTTTLRSIMRLWPCSAGQIEFAGRTMDGLSTPEVARMEIGYVPESMGIFAGLTVAENLTLAARKARASHDLDVRRLDWIFTFFPALQKFWRYPAGLLSGGQKQMLSVARAVIEPRRLLIIDEPTKGLAPAIVQSMADAFLQLKSEQTTILLVEQNFRFAQAVGDTVAVMEDGRIVHAGLMKTLADDASLQHRLLGLGGSQ